MKKRFGVVALAAAAGCAVIFAGCAGCNGCGASGKSNEAVFSSNWYADTNFRYIQPTFNADKDSYKGAEEITYKVKHDKETAGNTTYSIEYADGTYKTTFCATTFNKELIDEDYRADYSDNLTVYYYKTELYFPSVTYRIVNDEDAVKTFDDERTVTESYFLNVNDHLRPVYSAITTNTHIPAVYQTNDIDSAYEYVNQTVITSYKADGKTAKTVTFDGDGKLTDTKTVDELDKTNNSLVDVCGLNIAVRAMQLSTSLNQTVSVYSPAGGMQNYTFSASATALGEDEKKSYEDILAGKELYTKADDKSLSTICVGATLNDDMAGVSQKYWFTAIDNAKNNQGRTTMVKMSVPLTFSLGTLNYTLEEITNTVY